MEFVTFSQFIRILSFPSYKINLLRKNIRYSMYAKRIIKMKKIITSILVFLNCLLSLNCIQSVLDDMNIILECTLILLKHEI